MYIMPIGQLKKKKKKLLEDYPIPKSLSFLSCSQHNIKTPKTCYSSQSETGGEKGWVDNSISNQNPNKFYQAIDL